MNTPIFVLAEMSIKTLSVIPGGVFFFLIPPIFELRKIGSIFSDNCQLLHAFAEAAALRSIVLRYAGAPIAILFSFFLGDGTFSEFFFVPFPLFHCMESTSYVLSFRMVFFYLVTTGWIFYISLCENSINSIQSIIINNVWPAAVCMCGMNHLLSGSSWCFQSLRKLLVEVENCGHATLSDRLAVSAHETAILRHRKLFADLVRASASGPRDARRSVNEG